MLSSKIDQPLRWSSIVAILNHNGHQQPMIKLTTICPQWSSTINQYSPWLTQQNSSLSQVPTMVSQVPWVVSHTKTRKRLRSEPSPRPVEEARRNRRRRNSMATGWNTTCATSEQSWGSLGYHHGLGVATLGLPWCSATWHIQEGAESWWRWLNGWFMSNGWSIMKPWLIIHGWFMVEHYYMLMVDQFRIKVY